MKNISVVNLLSALIVAPSIALAAPDLSIVQITSSPANPVSGQPVTFSAVVKNSGSATRSGTIVGVAFYVNGTFVSWSDRFNTSLAAGASVTLTANYGPTGSSTWAAKAGTFQVSAKVDDVNRIKESNETNNTLVRSLTVIATPVPSPTPTPVPTPEPTPIPTPTPSPTGEQAKMADSFVDSIGTNMHLNFTGHIYQTRLNDIIAPRLAEIGIRHVRDTGPINDGQGVYYTNLVNYAKSKGRQVKFTLLMYPYGCTYTDARPAAVLKYFPVENLHAVENLNEHDNTYVGHFCPWNSATWVADVRKFQVTIWNAVKSNPTLANVKVVGPSITQMSNVQYVGDLSAYLDHGNIHSYPGGVMPLNAPTWINATKSIFGTKPVYATESGYHNDLATTGHKPISEAGAGKYMPRLYLNYFMSGVPVTHQYEFIDNPANTGMEGRFGLLRSDGSLKPAAVAVKNLIAQLNDPGSSFAAGKLNYSLAGATSDVKKLLLQKRDGTFYLLLWRELSVWDTTYKRDLSNPSLNVTLNLATPARSIEVVDISTSALPSATVTGSNNMVISVEDKVKIIRISP